MTIPASNKAGKNILKILVIRRDNIGDLVCTTPIFQALREQFPEALICALVNSYNIAVLENNPYINSIFSYTKVKHRSKRESIFGLLWDRFRLIVMLRKIGFDYAILAGPGFSKRSFRLAYFLKPKHIIGFTPPGSASPKTLDLGINTNNTPKHEVEHTFRLVAPLGIKGTPGPVSVYPSTDAAAQVRALIERYGWPQAGMLIGVHISARKPSQRWDADRFIEFIRAVSASHNARFLLLWSPGDNTNPLHPGDDRKAQQIMSALSEMPILAYPTQKLPELIAALSLCDSLVCSDGGAMHLASGLQKPILCFFGKSDAIRWHPWGVPYVLLQPPSLVVADISVEEATEGFRKLLEITLH